MDGNRHLDISNAQKIISQSSNWTFEGDCLILQWMEQISQNLETRAMGTIKSLQQLQTNLNRAQICLENTQNNLTALQYSQYVEMRCQEDTTSEAEIANVTNLEQQQVPASQHEILQVFLENNVKMLKNCHDKFNFLEESDEEDGIVAAAENCIYQPRNPYNERLLPHIYGTKMWKEQSHIGLEEDALADYSGDEKSEVYSITSSSSAQSEGRESPESRLTANTSQYTSSASLNNDASKIKEIPSISSTAPSVSSLPLEPDARKAPVDNLSNTIAVDILQPPSSIKKPTLNLFDDNDYKNLISEIVDKTQNYENSKIMKKIQADNSKIDLFASDDSLPPTITQQNQNAMPNRNSLQTQQIWNVNLFDSPTELQRDLFQDFEKSDILKAQTTQMPVVKTKLSAKNLFEDDDEDADFLNIFAKNSTSSADKTQRTKSLFEDEGDELDRQAVVSPPPAKPLSSLRHTAIDTTNVTQSKLTIHLFNDDEDEVDDFFARKPDLSNITKSLAKPKSDSFPAYLSTVPPEDINALQTETTSGGENKTQKKLSDGEHDDFAHLSGGSKQINTKTVIGKTNNEVVANLFAEDDNTQDNIKSVKEKEQIKDNEQISKTEILKAKTIWPQENPSIVKNSNNLFEKSESFDEFEKLIQTKRVTQDQPKELTKETTERIHWQENIAEKLHNENVIVENERSEGPKLNEQSQGHDKPNKPLGTEFIEEKDTLPEKPTFGSSVYLTEPPLSGIMHDIMEKNASEPTSVVKAADENDFLSIFSKNKSATSAGKENSEMTEPPLDQKLQVTRKNETEAMTDPKVAEEDDFLSIFSKKKSATSKAFEKNEQQQSSAAGEKFLEITKPSQDITTKNVFYPTPDSQAAKEDDFSSMFSKSKLVTLKEPAEVKTTSQIQQKILESTPKVSPPEKVASITAKTNFDETTETLQTAAHQQKPPPPPSFDNFSPLFLDEPPDDDDFLQAIGSSSGNNTVPPTQYGAENDFYEPTTQNLSTESRTEESTQMHTAYNNFSPLFLDEPPDDDDFLQAIGSSSGNNTLPTTQYDAENDLYEPTTEYFSTEPRAEESNFFAADKFSNFRDNFTPEPEADVFANHTAAMPAIDNQKPKSVTARVQAFANDGKEETVKSPSLNVSKLKLPKIEINVQALLPNAKKPKKSSLEAEILANEPLAEEQKQQSLEIVKSHAETEIQPTLPATMTTTKNYPNEPENAHLLPSLCKSRVRVPVKRKSSTRAGRQESYRRTLQAENNAIEQQGNDAFTQGERSNGNQTKKKTIGTTLPAVKQKPQQGKENNAKEISMSASSVEPLLKPTTLLQRPSQPAKVDFTAVSLFRDNDDGDDELFGKAFEKISPVATKDVKDKRNGTLIKDSQLQAEQQKSQFKEEVITKQAELPASKVQTTTKKDNIIAKQLTPKQTILASSSLFGESADSDDEDDFFGNLAQPKLPAIDVKDQTVVNVLTTSHNDLDDDLFVSNNTKAKEVTLTTKQNPKSAAKSQVPVSSKATTDVNTKLLENPTSKKMALFDSDGSSGDDNDNSLFKTKKSLTKGTFQAATKPVTADSTEKPKSSKTKSLFSDSDNEDDDLFGSSSASKPKNPLIGPVGTAVVKDPLALKQQKTHKAQAPSSKTADNPLADLLK